MNSLPSSYELNGPDTFLLMLDHLMMKSSGRGNICHFVITLGKPLPADTVRDRVGQNEMYQWATRLRLSGGAWIKVPQWNFEADADSFPITRHDLGAHEALRVQDQLRAIDPRTESPFQARLYGTEDEITQILFTWHHALMDAHGAELFMNYLGQGLNGEPLFFDENPLKPDHKEWRNALGIKETLYAITKYPFMSTFSGRIKKKPTLSYKVLSFNEADTEIIDQNTKDAGATVNKSVYYLAASARAVRAVAQAQGKTVDDVVTSIPQDRRRRGAAGPMFMNQVTFLFYRIPAAKLDSVKEIVADLSKQTMDLMRKDFPVLFLRMMMLFRHLPPFVYRHMVQQPTKKRMASFFFSDTGQSLDGFETFLGAPIRSALHYPPNMYAPGLTFIFSRFQRKLSVTISTLDEELSPEEVEALGSAIRSELLWTASLSSGKSDHAKQPAPS